MATSSFDTLPESEQWRPVGRLGVFEVSNFGRIRAARDERLKPQTRARSGFLVVNLYAGGRSCVRNVHSIVAEAFLGPRLAGFMVVHRDGDRRNNKPDNLEYRHLRERIPRNPATRIADSHGLKLCRAEADEIRRRARLGASTVALAEEFGVSAPSIASIKHGRKWRVYDTARGVGELAP